jgi:hypothetical protein
MFLWVTVINVKLYEFTNFYEQHFLKRNYKLINNRNGKTSAGIFILLVELCVIDAIVPSNKFAIRVDCDLYILSINGW